MVRLGIFSVFDNMFTDLYSPPTMQGCSPIKPVSQWTILQKNKHGGGGGGLEHTFLKAQWNF